MKKKIGDDNVLRFLITNLLRAFFKQFRSNNEKSKVFACIIYKFAGSKLVKYGKK